MLSGMKPPSSMPSSARQAKNEERPLRKACMLATRLQETIWTGIQRSGPSFLEMSWDGSSAARKQT